MIKTYHPRLPASSAVEVTSNDDLLIEILRRLPIKSLIEFKSVSKQWLSLISSPHFSLRRSASPATGLFIEASKFRNFRSADSNVPEFDFIDLNNPSPRQTALPLRFLTFAGANARIIQSCNGLLLCSNAHDAAQTFYVHNPTTKQYTALPPIPSSPRVYGVALAFDPLKSPHYKVICVTNPKSDPSEFLIGIYSSSSDEGEGEGWRPSLLGPFNSGFDTLFYRGVFWSGAVHWLSRCGPSLSFDVDEERMRELPMPPFSDVLQGIGRVYGFFGESGDHLHFVKHYLMAGESRLNVYEMKRDCSGWFVKYAVDIFELGDVFPEMVVVLDPDLVPPPDDFHYDDFDFDFFVFCVVRGVVEEGSYLVVNIPGKILRYNLESGTLCKLCDVPFLGIGVDISESTGAHQYIDSLACVDLKVRQ